MPSLDGGIVSVETVMLHTSGEWISNTASAPVTKNDAQGVGSCITYLRRYSLAAFCGIAQEDDDANASVGLQSTHASTATKPQQSGVIGPAEFKSLNAALDEIGANKGAFCGFFGIESVSQLPLSRYAEAMVMINSKREKRA
jgi:hypothetical protein